MCNLYDHELTPGEVKHLVDHYKLLGRQWAEVFAEQARTRNDSGLVYPGYSAPLVLIEDGKEKLEHMRWGLPGWMPPLKPGEKPKRQSFLTNVRNTASGHWKPWLAATNVTSTGKDKHQGGRCIVPARAFAEPDRRTSKPVQNRWFGRADGVPFFFAGIWREWTGDRGTIAKPDVGRHRLYGFLTTEPNAVVAPIHEKAMPVLLLTPDDVHRWLFGTKDEALALQKPANDEAIVVLPDKKKAA